MPDPDPALADLYELARKQGIRITVHTGLSPEEAQARLRERGIVRSLSQIRRMCASKTLSATLTPEGWRIEPASLESWTPKRDSVIRRLDHPRSTLRRLDRERFHLLTERQRAAAEAYWRGLTYYEIGQELGGISRQGASSLLQAAIHRLERTT